MGINFRKFFCRHLGGVKFFFKLFGCVRYSSQVKICIESQRRARGTCSNVELRTFRIGQEVPGYCNFDHTPPPPPEPPKPKWLICSETGAEATKWCPATEVTYEEPKRACRRHQPPYPANVPQFILFNEALWSRPDFDSTNIMNFCVRLGQAGVKWIRTFLGWPWDNTRINVFLPAGASPMPVDLYRFNPEWVNLVQTWQRCAAHNGMGFIVDFFGQQVCRPSYDWSWFAEGHNIQGINSSYDIRPHAIDYFKWCLAAVLDIVGIEGNLVHLGNEQQAPGDNGPAASDVGRIKEWARAYASPLCGFLKNTLNVQLPILCTGEPYAGTGHKISNRLIEEQGWPYEHIVNDLHGLTVWRAFEEWYKPGGDVGIRQYSLKKFYSISDDGASYTALNTPNDQERGICSHRDDGAVRCCCNQTWRIKMVEEVRKYLKLRFVEWMPQELKGPRLDTWHINDLNQEHSVDVYTECARRLWGADIRRDV